MKVVSPTEEPFGSVKARYPPGPGRDSGVERHGRVLAARALVGQHGAAEVDAVGTLDHQRQRRRRCWRCPARRAQQRGEIDGFVGAADAALGIDKGVWPPAGMHLP